MTTPELLADLSDRGVRLTAHGDRLLYDAPRGMMTPELVGRLKTHKPALLAILRGATSETNAGTGPQPETDIPAPPSHKAGYVRELVLRCGRWSWRQRRMDDADRAYAAYVATRQTRTAAREG